MHVESSLGATYRKGWDGAVESCKMAHVKSQTMAAWSLPSVALSMALLLAVVPPSEAMRVRTPAERDKTEELWRKAATPDTTPYGEPRVLVQSRTMSVDHFSSVRLTLQTILPEWYAAVVGGHASD